jgi:hypothetical protein
VTARARLVIALLLVAALGSVAHAAASSADKQARRSFQSAEAHFRAGRFGEALADYQAGYEKSPLPGFLINIAQCHRRLGDLHKARASYQKFVMVAPDSPHVPEVKTLIGELDRLIADLDSKKPEKPSREPEGETPPPAVGADPASLPPVSPPPAPPSPVAAAPMFDVRAPAPEPEPEPAPRAKSRWWLWGLIGVAVAGGTATAFALAPSSTSTTVHEGTLGTLRR